MTGEDFEAHLLMVGFVPHLPKREARCWYGIDFKGLSQWEPMVEQVFIHIDQHLTATVRHIGNEACVAARKAVYAANAAHFIHLPEDLQIHPDIARVLKHCS